MSKIETQKSNGKCQLSTVNCQVSVFLVLAGLQVIKLQPTRTPAYFCINGFVYQWNFFTFTKHPPVCNCQGAEALLLKIKGGEMMM